MSRGGPTARRAVDPGALVAYVDSLAGYAKGGHPVRLRRTINGRAVHESDLRLIRRWRSGAVKGVTVGAALELLARHALTLNDFATWASEHDMIPMLRGRLPVRDHKN